MLTKHMETIDVKAGPTDGLAEGQFTAYASVFGNIDSVGDVVMPGAFSSDLARWEKSGNPIPLLFGHNMTDPDYNLGHVIGASEDHAGLLVKAQLDLENHKAVQTYRMLKGKRINNMSFAYDEIDSGPATHDRQDVWELRAVKIYEISIVPIGANEETEILAVKQVPALADRLAARMKAGRVLSAKNEGELRAAYDSIGRVLTALDGTDEEKSASGDGPSCQALEHASRAASLDPSVVSSEMLSLTMELSV